MTLTLLETTFAVYWLLVVVSAAVSAMPPPTKEGWYSWFYKFSHTLTGNLDIWFSHKYGMSIPYVSNGESDTNP